MPEQQRQAAEDAAGDDKEPGRRTISPRPRADIRPSGSSIILLITIAIVASAGSEMVIEPLILRRARSDHRCCSQLWLFWIAPLVGGVLGGIIYRWLSDEPQGQVTGTSAS
jgi:hypothetical protein